MSLRKSSGHSLGKKQLKEKVVQIYEQIFQVKISLSFTFLNPDWSWKYLSIILVFYYIFQGDDPSLTNSNFWEEFFLLKPKPAVLESELCKVRGDQLGFIKPMIRSLFCQCVEVLGDTNSSSHHIKVCNSVQVWFMVLIQLKIDCGGSN